MLPFHVTPRAFAITGFLVAIVALGSGAIARYLGPKITAKNVVHESVDVSPGVHVASIDAGFDGTQLPWYTISALLPSQFPLKSDVEAEVAVRISNVPKGHSAGEYRLNLAMTSPSLRISPPSRIVPFRDATYRFLVSATDIGERLLILEVQTVYGEHSGEPTAVNSLRTNVIPENSGQRIFGLDSTTVRLIEQMSVVLGIPASVVGLVGFYLDRKWASSERKARRRR